MHIAQGTGYYNTADVLYDGAMITAQHLWLHLPFHFHLATLGTGLCYHEI